MSKLFHQLVNIARYLKIFILAIAIQFKHFLLIFEILKFIEHVINLPLVTG